MKEYIICSAVLFKDGVKYEEQPKGIESGFVICGRRHNNCFYTYSIMNNDLDLKKGYPETTEGFLTNTNRFVDRYEAYEIAEKAKQLKFVSLHGCLQSEFIFLGND